MSHFVAEMDHTEMKRSRKLLVLDDDPHICDLVRTMAQGLGYEVRTVGTGSEAIDAFTADRPDLVTLDVVLPKGIDGIQTLKELRSIDPGVAAVMLSGRGDTSTIVEAIKLGACDYLRKPFELEELEQAFDRALRKRDFGHDADKLRRDVLAGEPSPPLLGSSPKIQAVRELIDRVADTDITVLIRGESGSGKEWVARNLLQRSARSSGPFIKVNCAALPSELLESEVFGFERGAFTGAQGRKIGKFELAHNGTIFLDEISEMSPDLQAKLLQVLQDGHFSRLGSEHDIKVDARVLAATSRALESAVGDGSFRQDLFYRLNVVTIQIPPLRERRDEIPLLCERFQRSYSDQYAREYRAPSRRLMDAFLRYRWPGNLRELENMVKRMVVLQSEEPVLREIADRRREDAGDPDRQEVPELERFMSGEVTHVNLKEIGRRASAAAEKRVIACVLEKTRWNRRQAAELLQISYKALLYKMKESGLVHPI